MRRSISSGVGYVIASAAIVFSVIPASPVAGQDHPNVANGLQADSPYSFGDFDAVNIYNGAVTLTIPVGPRFRVHGDLSYQLNLFYNHDIWADFRFRNGAGEFDSTHNAGPGWRLGFGELSPCKPQNAPRYCAIGSWTLLEADGSKRQFYDQLHKGENDNDPNTYYTRDGSYLRLKRDGNTMIVESPNGTFRRFPINGGRMVEMKDRWENSLTIQYSPTLWTISERHRNHFIELENGVVKKIRVARFGGGHADYTLVHKTSIVQVPDRFTDNPLMPDSFPLQMLERIDLPEKTGSFQFFYYKDREDEGQMSVALPGCPNGKRYPGAIKRVVSPLGGKTRYSYRNYGIGFVNINQGGPGLPRSITPVPGAHCVSQKDITGKELGSWFYGIIQDPPDLEFDIDLDANERQDIRDVRDPLGFITRYHFTSVNTSDSDYSDDWRMGLPLSPKHVDAQGLKLSTEVFRKQKNVWKLLRSTWVTYTADPGASARYGNKRPVVEKTIYHDDLIQGDPSRPRWTRKTFGRFDGLGHHRKVVTEANFDGLRHVQYTDFNPASGDFNRTVQNPNAADSFVPFAPSTPWVLDTYSHLRTNENNVAAYVETCFSPETGGLLGRRVVENSATPGSAIPRGEGDIITRFKLDNRGDRVREEFFGGDVADVPKGQNLCNTLASLGSPDPGEYAIAHEWAGGNKKRSSYEPGGVTLLDREIDIPSGLPRLSRDKSGLETEFLYDVLGRVTEEHHETDAWKVITYDPPDGTTRARVEVEHFANRQTSGVKLTQGITEFDGFGRVVSERIKLPGGIWSGRWRSFDGAGNLKQISEFGGEGVTTFGSYDPFGRVGAITRPDGTKSTVWYTGVRVARTISAVGYAWNGAAVTSGSIADLRHFSDGLGRLRRVLEKAGNNSAWAETLYSYDVGSRMTKVRMRPLGNNSAVQTRQFIYDQRGFLLREQHPEQGVSGGGWVYNSQYDARGHVGRIVDGPNTLLYQYDAAERLTHVREGMNPGTRPLKYWFYGDENSGSNKQRNKVVRTERHNYFGALDQIVRETFQYRGTGGRVSWKQTEIVLDDSIPQQTFRQSFTWDALGKIRSITYPECALSNCKDVDGNQLSDPRVVFYTHSKGRLSSIPGSVNSFTYHKNGTISEIEFSNGIVERHEQDPNGMRRPRRISTTGIGGGRNFDSGFFEYDGTGNVTRIGGAYHLYDAVHRLKESYDPGSNVLWRYSYDLYGNLLSRTRRTGLGTGGAYQSLNTAWQSNHMSSRTYDGAGNVKFANGQSYTWDALNMLSTVEEQTPRGTVRALHVYNVDDERVQTYWGGVNPGGAPLENSFWQLRDLDGNVIRFFLSWDANKAWNIVRDGVYAGKRLVASRGWRSFDNWHVTDHLGSNRLIIDADGNAVRKDFHPFGQTATNERWEDLMNFAGHWRDPMVEFAGMSRNLDAMHARYHDPLAGRFLSIDPAGISAEPKTPQSWNRYAYALNNPLRYVDPDGESAKDVHEYHTRQVLESRGFSDQAINLVVRGNRRSDRFFGQRLKPKHHATGLFLSDDAANQRGQRVATELVNEAAGSAVSGKPARALKLLGQAMHTAEDSIAHAELGNLVETLPSLKRWRKHKRQDHSVEVDKDLNLVRVNNGLRHLAIIHELERIVDGFILSSAMGMMR